MGWLKNMIGSVWRFLCAIPGIVVRGLNKGRVGARNWFLPPVSGADGELPTIDTTVDVVAKWSATAFALLGGLLTFFGIKDGELDRVLRTNPRSALGVFCLLGVAVILGTLAPVIAASQLVRLFPLAAIIGLLGLFALLILPDFPAGDVDSIAKAAPYVIGVLAVVLVLLYFDLKLPLKAGFVVIAVSALTFGLYGAAKLSVRTKTAHVEPQVTLQIAGDASALKAIVAVSAAELESDEYLSVRLDGVTGAHDPKHATIGKAKLRPERTGTVQKTLEFALGTDHANFVAVRARKCEDTKTCKFEASDRQMLVRVAALPKASYSGSIVPATTDGKLDVALKGTRVDVGVVVQVQVQRTPATGAAELVAAATQRPDDKSAVEWKTTISTMPAGTLTLSYRECPETGECGASFVNVATLKTG